MLSQQGDGRADAAIADDRFASTLVAANTSIQRVLYWRADAGECNGKTYEVVGRDIVNTNDDALLQTRRFGVTQCKVPVACQRLVENPPLLRRDLL